MFDNMHESASLPELPVIMPQKRTPRAGAHLKNGSGITGPGRLLAIESGDVNSTEIPQSPTHKAFHGRMLAYIETHGAVTVSANGEGLAPASIIVGN